MSTGQIGMVALGDSDLVLANPDDDVRGLRVLDPSGHRVGEVDEIVVDEEERRARLLVVVSGGILGFGEDRRLVPVEAVTHVGDDVRLSSTDSDVRDGAEYEPALADAPDYAEVYRHYGYAPFWEVGYTGPFFHDRRHLLR
jgi:sporulation protein YlmC with PRC-barrel domain